MDKLPPSPQETPNTHKQPYVAPRLETYGDMGRITQNVGNKTVNDCSSPVD